MEKTAHSGIPEGADLSWIGFTDLIRKQVFFFQNPQGDFEVSPLKHFQILSAQKVRNTTFL